MKSTTPTIPKSRTTVPRSVDVTDIPTIPKSRATIVRGPSLGPGMPGISEENVASRVYPLLAPKGMKRCTR
ncbi:hypothetical protein BMS3Bbin16_01061 [archaeon BMS3Bbin16]|nr:hypothetical protein BMS3Bbin16_01061 [archaeon BMS3Bbin16]